jgi:hypothetical protein
MAHRAARLLPFLFLTTAVAVPALAQNHATARGAETSEAAVHFNRATALYTEADYAAALAEFKRAYDLSPRWEVLFNIGQSCFQLRDYASALTTLRRFASEGGDRISREDRATLDAELPELVARVAHISIASNVDGATVYVDDQAIGTTPLREAVLLSAGNRKIAVSHEGRAPVERRLAVVGGDAFTVHLDFAPIALGAAPRVTSAGGAPRAQPNYVPTYVSLLVGAAGLGIGTTFGVLALQDKSSLDHVCAPSKACPAASASDISSLTRNGTISTIGFGAAIVGAATALLLWIATKPSGASDAPLAAEEAPRPGAVQLLPFGVGVLAGSF